MANMNALQQMIFPDENAPIHRKKSVTAASVKSKGTVLGQKKPGGARKALNDITNKSGIHAKASSKNKQIASAAAVKDEIDIAGERFLHDHSKCIKEQQSLWDDHYSSDLILLHHESSIKEKHLNYDIEKIDAKDNLTYEEPEEMASPKLSDWLKNSTPWRSPIRHGSMMPSTPLAWRFDSSEFTLKEDSDDLF
ncbi:hypothetical protein ISN45_Aa03g015000 [Arabidopsis thaliana x Arabidopsis arenosa]|uniref:Protein PATRONUS 2 n=1 Tax=Arabidopsis thaliana x Arabidopsis arenosa TaxID=1240361 RepID=A0A8T2AZ92_9BRAS|nr:hypothetical protein ISN45_Aa03g015000 [Arabidopsis thaliana x Arabidopsis arenosa]